MRFDWQQDSKERYFRKAEEQIEAAGFKDFLIVERTAFGIVRNEKVMIFLKPIHKSGHTRKWWEAKRELECLKEPKPLKDKYGRPEKAFLIRGFLELEMEECDR